MSDRLDTIIKNGLVVLRGGTRKLDIGIRDGLIAQLADRLESEASRVIDAEGHYVLPGLVDAHVHLNEPGMGHWEGFATGSAALAAGGVTTYIDMPLNGTPPTVSLSALQQKLDAAKEHSHVDYAIWGGFVPRQPGPA
ncbi:amidohydrolase family protein [Paenibacillus sp. TAB 01]|uniref:amidohydrolase family protein n=1 Tax=Paenibacillus sp. TAB 01 TaxID=3368988 RepID=UPI0037504149